MIDNPLRMKRNGELEMSPRALFFNIPGHGHVNPSLPLVKELTRRGHQLTYFITEGFREKIEEAGAAVQLYSPLWIKDDYFEARGLNGGRPSKVADELMITTEAILPELLATTREANPDYILFDGMCPWGYWVARAINVPAVASLSLMPPIRFPLKAILNREMLRLLASVLARDFRAGLDANRRSRKLGKSYGVQPLGQISILNAEGDISLAYTSPEFQPYSNTVKENVRFVGWTREQETGIDPCLFENVNGRPLIYVSLGTLNNKNKGFFDLCIKAFAGRDEYVMITTGNQFRAEDFGKLAENISVHPWLPQAAVLGRADLFISHGGLNSIHDGLYFGVPLLLCPQQEEQGLNASRVVELGAGLKLNPGQLRVETILDRTALLLAAPSFKEHARRIGETLRNAGGMKKAGDIVEELLKREYSGAETTKLNHRFPI